MKKIKSYSLIFLINIIFNSCVLNKSNSKKVDIFEQYSYLLKTTYTFLEDTNGEIINSLNVFLKYNKDYNFNSGRFEFVICKPLLFNSKKDKALIFVLTRDQDFGGRIERIRFLSANIIDDKWEFKFKKGSTFSYSYEGDIPTLTDQEITLRALNIVIGQGYLYKNSMKINDDYFQKCNWYCW